MSWEELNKENIEEVKQYYYEYLEENKAYYYTSNLKTFEEFIKTELKKCDRCDIPVSAEEKYCDCCYHDLFEI